MNRKQAENLLNAYESMIEAALDGEVRSTLREVILDAMTSEKQIITLPQSTWTWNKPIYTWDTTPVMTCSEVNQ